MIEIILAIELGILGLIIIGLALYPHQQIIVEDEMKKLDGLKSKMKEMNEKLQNKR